MLDGICSEANAFPQAVSASLQLCFFRDRNAETRGDAAEETLRRSFARLLAATPQDYRARFSC
jgi:hypothetical protein